MKLDKRTIKNFVNNAAKMLKEKSPVILTGCGIAGFFTTIAFAVKATPKASKAIEREQSYKQEKLTKVETAKIAWKYYIPTAGMAVVSTACVIGGQSINLKRNAALASLYSISESKLKEYQTAIVDTVGKKKADEVQEKVDENILKKHPVEECNIYDTGRGNTLFFEPMTARYFRSDQEYLRRCMNDLNQGINLGDDSASLNDYFFLIGLEDAKLAENVGWTTRKLLDISWGAKVATNGEPCIVLNYEFDPKYLVGYFD